MYLLVKLHNIAEILLKLALSTNQSINQSSCQNYLSKISYKYLNVRLIQKKMLENIGLLRGIGSLLQNVGLLSFIVLHVRILITSCYWLPLRL